MLDFYAERVPIFLAAVFDADAAAERGQAVGDGTPVHITIPTDNPWVPLRILALGKTGDERVEADVYLLTDQRAGAAPRPDRRQRADAARPQRRPRDSLLDDLRSDRGMEWVPNRRWLTKVAHRCVRAAALVRPRDRRQRRRRAVADVMAGLVVPGLSAPDADTMPFGCSSRLA